jgi:hypothetical protein
LALLLGLALELLDTLELLDDLGGILEMSQGEE